MALAERRTAAAGGSQATVSTPTGVWTELTTAMVNAGWVLDTDWSAAGAWPAWTQNTPYPLGSKVTANGNRYYAIVGGTSLGSGTGPNATVTTQGDGSVVWEYQSTSATTADAIYSSTGESGNEKIWVRVWVNTTFVNVEIYQYFASNVKYNAINMARTANINTNQKTQQFNYSGSTTINFAVIADKDSIHMVTVDQLNAKRTINFGLLRRFPTVNTTSFVSNNSVTVGANKTFTFSSGDPVAAGYQIGDPIMVVSQQTTGSGNMIIPCFSSRITALTTNSITVLNVPEAVDPGALVGADPFPAYGINSQATSGNPFATNAPFCHNYNSDSLVNTYNVSGQAGTLMGLLIPLRDSAILEMDPNNRTGYQQITEEVFYIGNSQMRGSLMKTLGWNTQTNNQWVIAKEVRVSPVKDWLFVRDTPPSTGGAWVMGPFNATTATVSFQSYTLSDLGYQELDIHPTKVIFQDRGSAGLVPSKDFGYHRHHNVEEPVDVDQEMWVFVNHVKDILGTGSSRRFQGNLFTVEPYPFDSATSTQGGTSNGFNSGFN